MNMNQINEELAAWLAERSVTLAIIAIGNRTGSKSNLADFLPDTHHAEIMLVEVKQDAPKNTPVVE